MQTIRGGYSYFVGWATCKSWGGLFVIRGVVAVAVVWGVVAVYGAGVISESGPIVSVLGDCAGGYWGDGTHRKFQSGIKFGGCRETVQESGPRTPDCSCKPLFCHARTHYPQLFVQHCPLRKHTQPTGPLERQNPPQTEKHLLSFSIAKTNFVFFSTYSKIRILTIDDACF